MPNSKKEKTELNYGNGVVYIIWNTTAPVRKVYIGSTARTMKERMDEHRNSRSCESRSIIESGTYDYQILEHYPCNNEDELHDREAYYILTNWDSCVNKRVPGAIRRAGGKKKYYKQYNKEHKAERSAYNKQYQQEHKAERATQYKQYRQQNAEKITEYKKQKIQCNLCGTMSTKNNIATHRKTKKCRAAVQSQVKDVLNDMIKQICYVGILNPGIIPRGRLDA